MRHLLLALLLTTIALPAAAQEVRGQNAATRALVKPLAGIAKPVPNPKNVPCTSTVDCREKGRDLETIWQLETPQASDTPAYPDRCYARGQDGKYSYRHRVC